MVKSSERLREKTIVNQNVNNYFSEAFSSIKVPLDSPAFYQRTFSYVAKRRKKMGRDESQLDQLCLEEFDNLSRRLDVSKIQDSPSVRNLLRARSIANAIIDEKGELNLTRLPILLKGFVYRSIR